MHEVRELDFTSSVPVIRIKGFLNRKGLGGFYLYPNKTGVLMQYIGMKDKNGKEIWEGDIIRHDNEYDDVETSPIEFEQVGFWPTSFDNEYGWPPEDEIEVIGNIYENPELLKVG